MAFLACQAGTKLSSITRLLSPSYANLELGSTTTLLTLLEVKSTPCFKIKLTLFSTQ